MQFAGGAFVLAGVALVRADELRSPRRRPSPGGLTASPLPRS
ncbi:MAG TPA: hypothetical protein VH641_15105 [Streptosporangiaceae bacterium]